MDLITQLRNAILSQNLPPPSTSFLNTLITARTPPPPLPSLIATAKARLLACDLSSSHIIDPSSPCLPPGLDNPQQQQQQQQVVLRQDIHVQVIDVENLSLSRWEQIQELEAVERGEATRGREVIRVIEDTAANEGSTQSQQQTQQQQQQQRTTGGGGGAAATHRLTLQDRSGRRVYALEEKRVGRIGVGVTSMGEKMVLRAGTNVARGVVLLGPESCVVLGGKIDAWQRAWVEGRIGRLREAIGDGGEGP